ncbi:MAG: hypothetical protein P8M18_12965 [Woeseiaceae bacterium]|nr:hypothetical protein [Woeseiaceae bacterium]
MSRKSNSNVSQNYFCILYIMVIGLSLLAGSGIVLAAGGIQEERTSVSRHHVTGGRDNPIKIAESEEQYESLVSMGDRGKSDTRGASKNSGEGIAGAQSGGIFDFWFYEADVIVFNDDDNDG